MRQHQAGFTLIELVMVIVILGILAATALPRFVDLKSEANAAALQGVAGAINSASVINYAAKSANSAKGQTTTGLSCTAAANAILETPLDSTKYTLGATPATLAAGPNTCVLTQVGPPSATANVTIIGV